MGRGEVTGGGVFNKGHEITVTATPNPGYTFVRWTEDGKEVSRNASYTFTVEKDRTLLAEFAVASSGGGSSGPSSYAVTPAKADNGTVTTDPAKAKQGDAVTVTPAPDEGYKEEAVTVTDKNGKPVTVKDNGDGTYSFTMPASAVNVAVSFAKEEIQPTPPTPPRAPARPPSPPWPPAPGPRW